MRKISYILIVFFLIFILSGCKNYPSAAKLPDGFVDDKEAFGDSLKKFGEASDITNGSDRNASGEETKSVLSLTLGSIESSKKVSDEFLDYLHPNLKNYYHDKFVKSQQLYYEGLSQSKGNDTMESESVKKQIEAGKLMKEWLAWYELTDKEIVDKLFAE